MELLWYVDRAAGLVGFATLYLAVLTGVLYEANEFGILHQAAKRVHVEVSVLAILVMGLHAIVGTFDVWLMVSGETSSPVYSDSYLLAGVAVGAGSLLLIVVSVLGFLDARRFQRPWTPRVVHAFAYGGFAFAVIHAAAVGTDFVGLVRPGLIAAMAFLGYVLLLRLIVRFGPPEAVPDGVQ